MLKESASWKEINKALDKNNYRLYLESGPLAKPPPKSLIAKCKWIALYSKVRSLGSSIILYLLNSVRFPFLNGTLVVFINKRSSCLPLEHYLIQCIWCGWLTVKIAFLLATYRKRLTKVELSCVKDINNVKGLENMCGNIWSSSV